MKVNFLSFKFSKELEQLLTKYELSVGTIYWIFKNYYKEIEKMYFEQVDRELEQLQSEKADERDMEGEQINDSGSNELDNQ